MTIGIMGGTFDPIHNGHLRIAEEAKAQLGCDIILWIPTGCPPHKRTSVSNQDRVAMLRLAVAGLKGHALDLCEVEREGYTRTVDTLKYLHGRYPGATFVFLIGGDTVLQLHTWKDFATVTTLCSFGVALRPGVSDAAIQTELKALTKTFRLRYQPIQLTRIPISSSEVRARLAEGKDVSADLPDGVLGYIQEHDLYKELVE